MTGRNSLFLTLALLVSCGGEATTPAAPARPTTPTARQSVAAKRPYAIGAVQPLAFPFSKEAMAPYVIADGQGGFLISWTEKEAVSFAGYRGGRWFQPRAIATGKMLRNRANFPSLATGPKNTLFAQWVEEHGHGSSLHLARSSDGGATWTAPVTPHPDLISQFGFASILPEADGSLHAVWLDGRQLEGGEEGNGDMALYSTTLTPEGKLGPERAVDLRICDCCQTSMAMTAVGPLVAYRDRSPKEIRDIAVSRLGAEGWSSPRPLHTDGFQITGCPVNGPQLAASGNDVVAAWFTAAQGKPTVNVAFSADSGTTFGSPLRIDDGKPAGRVAVARLDDGTALVTWVEQRPDSATIEARLISADGKGRTVGPIVRIAEGPSASAIGFPRLAVSNDNVVVAWNGEPSVKLATIHLTRE